MEQEPEEQVLRDPSRSKSRSLTSGTESDRSRSKSRRGTKRRKRSSERNEEQKSTKRRNCWRDCGRVDHGVCYGVYTNKIGFVHICSECANRFNLECTSADMKDFYKKRMEVMRGLQKKWPEILSKKDLFLLMPIAITKTT